MVWNPSADHPLRRMFASYTEQTFQQSFGVADPNLTDYLSGLLCRFLHTDAIHRLKELSGKRLDQVAALVAEVSDLPQGPTRREIHRHIGDFTLFWTGVYPEMLRRLKAADRLDYFVDYCRQGKVSYSIAASFDNDPYKEEAAVLGRLSEEFELCAYGLQQVRREWERDENPLPRLLG